MDILINDLRYAWRVLRKTKGRTFLPDGAKLRAGVLWWSWAMRTHNS